jgi:hypothetical protein
MDALKQPNGETPRGRCRRWQTHETAKFEIIFVLRSIWQLATAGVWFHQ